MPELIEEESEGKKTSPNSIHPNPDLSEPGRAGILQKSSSPFSEDISEQTLTRSGNPELKKSSFRDSVDTYGSRSRKKGKIFSNFNYQQLISSKKDSSDSNKYSVSPKNLRPPNPQAKQSTINPKKRAPKGHSNHDSSHIPKIRSMRGITNPNQNPNLLSSKMTNSGLEDVEEFPERAQTGSPKLALMASNDENGSYRNSVRTSFASLNPFGGGRESREVERLMYNSPFRQSFIHGKKDNFGPTAMSTRNNRCMSINLEVGLGNTDMENYQRLNEKHKIIKTSVKFFRLFEETATYLKDSKKLSELSLPIMNERIKALKTCFERSDIKGAKMIQDLEDQIDKKRDLLKKLEILEKKYNLFNAEKDHLLPIVTLSKGTKLAKKTAFTGLKMMDDSCIKKGKNLSQKIFTKNIFNYKRVSKDMMSHVSNLRDHMLNLNRYYSKLMGKSKIRLEDPHCIQQF